MCVRGSGAEEAEAGARQQRRRPPPVDRMGKHGLCCAVVPIAMSSYGVLDAC